MDERLLEVVGRKVEEVARDLGGPGRDVASIPCPPGADRFAYGVAVGRLYNSFRYQCRRILGRDPTAEEVGEFADLVRRSAGRLT